MLKDYFIYNGIDSRDVALRFQQPISFTSANPEYEEESVPGRNGTLSKWKGKYSNVTGKVSLFQLTDDISESIKATSKLLYEPGYHRLEVSDDPDVYRIAKLKTGISQQLKAGHLNAFTLTFDCKPQKFLKSGEEEITISSTGTKLYNPYFDSLPLITVYGSKAGTVTIGNYTVSISNIDGWVTIDCDTQDAYKGTTNCNSNITTSEFPKIVNGENTVAFSGGVTNLKIIPRWWLV